MIGNDPEEQVQLASDRMISLLWVRHVPLCVLLYVGSTRVLCSNEYVRASVEGLVCLFGE